MNTSLSVVRSMADKDLFIVSGATLDNGSA